MSQIGELESLELLWLVMLLRITLLGRSRKRPSISTSYFLSSNCYEELQMLTSWTSMDRVKRLQGLVVCVRANALEYWMIPERAASAASASSIWKHKLTLSAPD